MKFEQWNKLKMENLCKNVSQILIIRELILKEYHQTTKVMTYSTA
jgi:hypothetical protein